MPTYSWNPRNNTALTSFPLGLATVPYLTTPKLQIHELQQRNQLHLRHASILIFLLNLFGGY